jgi:hypothetical protein
LPNFRQRQEKFFEKKKNFPVSADFSCHGGGKPLISCGCRLRQPLPTFRFAARPCFLPLSESHHFPLARTSLPRGLPATANNVYHPTTNQLMI